MSKAVGNDAEINLSQGLPLDQESSSNCADVTSNMRGRSASIPRTPPVIPPLLFPSAVSSSNNMGREEKPKKLSQRAKQVEQGKKAPSPKSPSERDASPKNQKPISPRVFPFSPRAPNPLDTQLPAGKKNYPSDIVKSAPVELGQRSHKDPHPSPRAQSSREKRQQTSKRKIRESMELKDSDDVDTQNDFTPRSPRFRDFFKKTQSYEQLGYERLEERPPLAEADKEKGTLSRRLIRVISLKGDSENPVEGADSRERKLKDDEKPSEEREPDFFSPRGVLSRKPVEEKSKINPDFFGRFDRKLKKQLLSYFDEMDRSNPQSAVMVEHQIHLFFRNKIIAFIQHLHKEEAYDECEQFFRNQLQLRDKLAEWQAELVHHHELLAGLFKRLQHLQSYLGKLTEKKSTAWSYNLSAVLNRLLSCKEETIDAFLDYLDGNKKTIDEFILRALGDQHLPTLLQSTLSLPIKDELIDHALHIKWFYENPIRFQKIKDSAITLRGAEDEILRTFIPHGILILDVFINGEQLSFQSFAPPASQSETKKAQIEFFTLFLSKILEASGHASAIKINLQEEAEKIVRGENSIFTPFLSLCMHSTLAPCELKMRTESLSLLFGGTNQFRSEKAKGAGADPTAGIVLEITASSECTLITRSFNYTIYRSIEVDKERARSMMPQGKFFIKWTIPGDEKTSVRAGRLDGSPEGEIEFIDYLWFPEATAPIKNTILATLTNPFDWERWALRQQKGQTPLIWRDTWREIWRASKPLSFEEWIEPALIDSTLALKQLVVNGEQMTFPEGNATEKRLSAIEEQQNRFLTSLKLALARDCFKPLSLEKVLRACAPAALEPSDAHFREGYASWFTGQFMTKAANPIEGGAGKSCFIETRTEGALNIFRNLLYTVYYKQQDAPKDKEEVSEIPAGKRDKPLHRVREGSSGGSKISQEKGDAAETAKESWIPVADVEIFTLHRWFSDWRQYFDVQDVHFYPDIDLKIKLAFLSVVPFDWRKWALQQLKGQKLMVLKRDAALIDNIFLEDWLEPTFISSDGLAFKRLVINGKKISFPKIKSSSFEKLKKHFISRLVAKIACEHLDASMVDRVLKACSPITLKPFQELFEAKYPVLFTGNFTTEQGPILQDESKSIVCKIDTRNKEEWKVTRIINNTIFYKEPSGATAQNVNTPIAVANIDVMTVLTWKDSTSEWICSVDIADIHFHSNLKLRIKLEFLASIHISM